MLTISTLADIARALADMPLERKVAQLCSPILQQSELPDGLRHFVRDLGVGVVRYCPNATYDNASRVVGRPNRTLSPAENAALLNDLQALACAAPAGAPVLVAIDQEGGTRNDLNRHGALVYGSHMAFGAANDAALTERVAFESGLQMRALGIHLVQAPITDVISFAGRRTIKAASFGEDPACVARHAVAMLRGYQRAGMAAMAKHFPGYGATAVDAHKGLASVDKSLAELECHDNLPLRAVLDAGADGLMTGHVRIDALDPAGLPATLSRPILQGLLRETWGFDGLVESDALRMPAIQERFGTARAAVMALQAGCDLLLLRGDDAHFLEGYEAALAAARDGLLPMARLDASVARLLRLKLKLGLFARPDVDLHAAAPAFARPEAAACATELADRSVRVLRQAAGGFPWGPSGEVAVLAAEPSKIAGAADPVQSVDMLAKAVRHYHPRTAGLVLPPDPDPAARAAALAHAAAADRVVVGAFNALNAAWQVDLVRAVLRLGKPVAVVAMESPYDLLEFPEAPTVLATFGVAERAVDAAARVLFGKLQPATGLPVTLG